MRRVPLGAMAGLPTELSATTEQMVQISDEFGEAGKTLGDSRGRVGARAGRGSVRRERWERWKRRER